MSVEPQIVTARNVPVLLLHGFTESGDCWEALADELQGPFSFHTPAAPGHGGRRLTAPGLPTELLVDEAAALLRELGGAAIVIGHSMGARTALQLASRFPDLVSRLVLEDPPLWPGAEAEEKTAAAAGAQMFADVRAIVGRPIEERERWVAERQPRWTERDRHLWTRALGELDLQLFEGPLFDYPETWRAEMRRVSAPTLLVCGDQNFGGVAAEAAAEAEQLVPATSRVVVLEGTGHSPRRERPAEFAQLVRDHLAGAAVKGRRGL